MREVITYASWKYVDAGKEAADLFIMNQARSGDIVITQDIGLAATLLPKGVHVLSPKGSLYDEDKMQTALEMRCGSFMLKPEEGESTEKGQNHFK